MSQQQFILPVEPWIKFCSTTVGRDKLYRTVQYTAKFLAHYSKNEDLQVRLARLSAAIGLARKLFRFGKPVDFVQTILKSMAIQDDVIRYCAIGRSAFLAGWLTLDTFQWLHAQKVITLEQPVTAVTAVTQAGSSVAVYAQAAASMEGPIGSLPWVNKNAARCWFIGLLFAISADLWRLRGNVQRLESLEHGGDSEAKKEAYQLKKDQRKIVLELVQDTLDLVIPGSILGVIKADNGFVGLVGTITSIIGFNSAWPRS